MKQTAVEWLELYIKGITTLNCDDIIEQAKEMEKEQRGYSEEEVIKLLITCKDRFGGSDLYDYTHDNEVKKWFEDEKLDKETYGKQ